MASSRRWRICPTPNWIPARLNDPPTLQLDDGWMDHVPCPCHHCPPRAPNPPRLLSQNPSSSQHHGLAHTWRENHLARRGKGRFSSTNRQHWHRCFKTVVIFLENISRHAWINYSQRVRDEPIWKKGEKAIGIRPAAFSFNAIASLQRTCLL